MARLKVHDVGAGAGAALLQQLHGLPDVAGGEAEGLVALLAAGDGLENHVRRGAPFNRLQLGGDVPQDADLGGDFKLVFHLVEAL